MADVACADERGLSVEAESDESSSVRKDMTRLLQYIPPVDVGEKVINFLLDKAKKTVRERLSMTGEEIVTTLASLPIDAILRDLDVTKNLA